MEATSEVCETYVGSTSQRCGNDVDVGIAWKLRGNYVEPMAELRGRYAGITWKLRRNGRYVEVTWGWSKLRAGYVQGISAVLA